MDSAIEGEVEVDTARWRARFTCLGAQPVELGLERMRAACARLGHPERRLGTLVHIAGTNGKGGVVLALETALAQAGIAVQSYSSPFLWRFEETLRLQTQPIAPDLCAAAFAEVWQVCADLQPTWFEADTLVALLIFARTPSQVTVLECGMGGARDATAVVPPPAAAVLTNVSDDHAEFLGTDLARVAEEKAGIAKGGPLYVPEDFRFSIPASLATLVRVGEDQTPLNVQLANAVLQDLFPQVAPLTAAPPHLGRWYRDPEDPRTIYDVGHNAHAARYLATRLAQEPGPYRLDLGMLRRKDPRTFLRAFVGLDVYVCPQDLGDQGHSMETLQAAARAVGLRLWDRSPYQTRLITGSHLLVAQTLKKAVRASG